MKLPTRPTFLKQKIMLRVLYALAPVTVVSIYYFGWRIAAILAVSVVFGFSTEWIMVSRRNGKVSYACFVTATLYGLSLPPTTPFWIVAVGIIVAILFGKEVFGGFGKNVFNPAIVGRGFVYVCFPVEITSRFVPVFGGFPGGFAHWSMHTISKAPEFISKAGLKTVDAITSATPMWANRDYGYTASTASLFLGNIGGIFEFAGQKMVLAAGSAGETCALVILLSGVYLILTKTAQWRLTVSTLIGALVSSVVFRHLLGIESVPPLSFTLFSGALCFAAVFMVTDPVSAPKLSTSQWIYGAFIGVMIVFFRFKSIFVGGVAFSILLGNMLAPSLDLWIKRIQGSKKEAQSE